MAKNPVPLAPAPTVARPKHPRRVRRWIEVVLALVCAPVVVVVCLRHLCQDSGLAKIRDDQVGVLVDAWTRSTRIVDTPGYTPYLPWFQSVHTIDKSPNAFVFRGNTTNGWNEVPRLLIRARDGSSFWFDEVTLQYALRVESADVVLDDSGGGDAFKEELLRCHARAILRDEFGRFAAGDSARPESVAIATRASLDRMNTALAPHGIEVLEVSSPKPAFDKKYEDMINRRKLANQETDQLLAQADSLKSKGELSEQTVRKEKELELLKLEGNLANDVGAAERELVRARAEADNVYAERVSQGRIAKAEKELQADVLTAKYRGLAEDARARADALAAHGSGSVRAALVDRLADIQFEIVPYSRDPAPQRIEYEQPSSQP